MKNHTTKTATEFPVHVTGEPTNITIYMEPHNGTPRFMVSYYDAACQRHRRRCSSYEKADALADKLRKEIKTGGWDVLTLRGSEKHAYERCRDWLRRCGKPLDFVVHEYVEAAGILKGLSVVEAARSFVQSQSKPITPKPAPEVLRELLDDLKRTGKSKWHIRDLRIRLGKFTQKFACPLGSISAPEIRDYVQKLNGAARYRNHVIDAIGTLISFGKDRAYVNEDSEGVSKIAKYEVRRKEVEVFTPAELEAMLKVANPEVQRALALTSFAGVRGAELGRLDWSDIQFDLGCIRVKAANAKTGIRRVPPIPENLRAWLTLDQDKSGPVVGYKNIYNQYLKVAKKAGVKWKRNSHRHGFASYRTALIKNLDQVAIEAGHSKQELLEHYFKVVSEAAAKAWFSIFPSKKGQEPEANSMPDAEPEQK